MSAVIPFVRPASRLADWSQQELAEFYRVEAALIRAGIGIASDHGLSDEGEPWFVFCRPDGDAIMHFARIDGSYLIASDVLDHPVRGADFRALIDQIARLHPHLLPIPAAVAGTKLVVHPAALLAALVAAAALILSSEDAHAGEIELGLAHVPPDNPSDGGGTAPDQAQPTRAKGTAGPGEQGNGRIQFEAIILSTMIFAAEALASDHGQGSADLGQILSDLASAAGHAMTQGDLASGLGSGAAAGTGATATIQPGILTAQGSGFSQDTAFTAGRTDPAPSIRIDLPSDRPPPAVREATHTTPGIGTEAGLTRVAAETGAVGTSGQQNAATGHAEATVAPSAGSVADGSDPRGNAPQPSASEPTTSSRLAEAAPSDTGSGTASQARVLALGQTETGRVAAVSVLREGNDRGSDQGRGAQAEAASAEGPKAERADDGPSRGPGRSGQGDLPGPDAASSPAKVPTTAPGQGSEKAAGGQEKGPGNGPGEHGPGTSSEIGAAHATSPSSGPSHGNSDEAASRNAAPENAAAPAPVASQASLKANAADTGGGPTSHGQNPNAADQAPSSHKGDEPARAQDHSGSGPSSSSADQTGPGKQDASRADQNTSEHGSPSSGGRHDATDHDAATQGGSAPQDVPSSQARVAATSSGQDPEKVAGGPEQSQGHGPSSEHGPPGQKGDEQDHSGPKTSANSADQTGPGKDDASHPGQTQPEPDKPSQGASHDAADHTAAVGPPATHGGSAPPAETGPETAGATGSAPQHADHGAKGPSAHASGAEAQPSPDDGAAVHTTAVPAHDQASPAGTGKPTPSDPAEASTPQPAFPRAAIDAHGNLVFHGDTPPDASPAAHGPQVGSGAGPEIPPEHPHVGLVGLPDHGHIVHDLYHHG
ncbi:hypothetical protein ACFQE0_04890 [Methylobacterium komagatae]|uniref:Uncharacterized protein n=1 Tax=Methylobacterium komagatae TaxID=374425 RepID=A0ABW2BF44_9HYPH